MTASRRATAFRTICPFAIALSVAACKSHLTPHPDPHYVLGPAYQAGKIWYYPRDSLDLNETGIAAIIAGDQPRLTVDGEVFDQTALSGSHPTLQLPAIARLTNLENGREVVVRLNDRGSGDPGRLVEVTRRTATLLGFPPAGLARVRLQVLPVESQAAANAVRGAPSLAMNAAPRGTVEIAVLLPPPGVRQGGGRAARDMTVAAPEMAPPAAPPMRLPETVTQTAPRSGKMIVRLDAFSEYQYAAMQCAKMGWSSTQIASVREGAARRFRAESSPLTDVARADAILKQALAAGIPDARIVVE